MGLGIGGDQGGYQTFRQGMSDVSGAIIDAKSRKRMAGASQEAFKIMQDPNNKPTPAEMQDWASRWQLNPQEVMMVAKAMKEFRSMFEPGEQTVPVEINGKTYNVSPEIAHRYIKENKPQATFNIGGREVSVPVNDFNQAKSAAEMVGSQEAESMYPMSPTRPRGVGEAGDRYANVELDTINKNLAGLLEAGAVEEYSPKVRSLMSEQSGIEKRLQRDKEAGYPFSSAPGIGIYDRRTNEVVRPVPQKGEKTKLSEAQKSQIETANKRINDLFSNTTIDAKGFERTKTQDEMRRDQGLAEIEYKRISAIENGKRLIKDNVTGEYLEVTPEELQVLMSEEAPAQGAPQIGVGGAQEAAPQATNETLRQVVEKTKAPAEKVQSLSRLDELTAREKGAPWVGYQPEEFKGETIATKVQNFMGQTQAGSRKKFGEGDIENALRVVGIKADNLQERKRIAEKLMQVYGKDETEIARMIRDGEILSEDRGK